MQSTGYAPLEATQTKRTTATRIGHVSLADDKQLCAAAKDKAMLKYVNRETWISCQFELGDPTKTCAHGVLQWKNGTALAHVFLQGLKHEDSTTLFHKESTTMSRSGRSFILLVWAHQRLDCFSNVSLLGRN